MVTIQQLREKIANLATQANHLLAEKGDQIWSPEDQAKFDGFTNEINAARQQITNVEKMRELEADKFFQNPAQKKPEDGVEVTALVACALYLRNGMNLSADQAAQIRNVMSTTTGSEGGFTVPTEVASMVIERLKAYGGMREVATVMPTVTGDPMNWPTSDGTGEEGEIVSENAQTNVLDVSFGTVGLPVFNYSSKAVALPLQLIQDSAIDVVTFVVNRLAVRIARIQNRHYTVGTGTGQPLGMLTVAGVGKVAPTGQSLTVTYDDLVDLKHAVNRAYRKGAKYMMNDTTVQGVSKIKDTVGRPIWIPAITEGAPDMLNGHAVTINDDVPVMAANAKSIAFGDFSQYTIRDVKNSTIMRRFDDSAFGLKGQAGFCGWTRSGGNLLEPAAVKVFQNSAT
ncbi:phage major capsid protein [Telluria beijingensis]|uniref:phage major capsid protein n=1 Tax=Telluria beijingensis TaxID=3068633 RepID=UPI00279529FD|nr:phage major capsid protein [Massilia sp. REN29]